MTEESFALHPGNARCPLGTGSTQEQLTELVGWCDGSWADLDEKRRSTTGGLLMLGGACVAGWSHTQKPTAMSSGESELYSATVCTCDLVGLRIFERVGIHHCCPAKRSCISLHSHGDALGTRKIEAP